MMCGVPTEQIELSLTFDTKPANIPPVRSGNFVHSTRCAEAAGPEFDSDGLQSLSAIGPQQIVEGCDKLDT